MYHSARYANRGEPANAASYNTEKFLYTVSIIDVLFISRHAFLKNRYCPLNVGPFDVLPLKLY